MEIILKSNRMIKLVFTGIPILVALVNAEMSRFDLGSKYNGKTIFGKEGENLNLIWIYKIQSLLAYRKKYKEFLFGEWEDPGFVSRKCFKVDEYGKVFKAKGCEDKYGYKGVSESNGVYKSNVVIYNLTKSDMEKRYGIDIEMGIYTSPLEDWFELRTFVKAKIAHFFISRNTTVKEGDALNITCRATGEPEANVTLYKQDQFIKEGKGEVMYQIHKTAMHHASDYVCVASNDEVEVPDRRRITLSVEDGDEYVCVVSNDDVEAPDRKCITLSVEGAAQLPRLTSRSKKCFSEPWILGFLIFTLWI